MERTLAALSKAFAGSASIAAPFHKVSMATRRQRPASESFLDPLGHIGSGFSADCSLLRPSPALLSWSAGSQSQCPVTARF